MHEAEPPIPINAALVTRLLESQCPECASLPVVPVDSQGTDHAIFRIGDDRCARLPRVEWAIAQRAKEHAWLPRLAPSLGLEIPVPLTLGRPGCGYPWAWSVYPWFEGADLFSAAETDRDAMIDDIARFLRELHAIDVAGGPAPGEHNFGRGVPLADRDALTREMIDLIADEFDSRALLVEWDRALQASASRPPGTWIHGDLHGGNIIIRDARVRAIVDFGGLGVGDLACDLAFAWTSLSATERAAFRRAYPASDDAWLRARGWALTTALTAIPYYTTRLPPLADRARGTVRELLAHAS